MKSRFVDSEEEAISGITVLKFGTDEDGVEDDDASDDGSSLTRRIPLTQTSPKTPPKYRDGNETEQCGTCSFLAGTECTKYNVGIELSMVCDSWAANPVARNDETAKRGMAAWKPPGEPEIDAIQSDFTENPAYDNPQGPAGIES